MAKMICDNAGRFTACKDCRLQNPNEKCTAWKSCCSWARIIKLEDATPKMIELSTPEELEQYRKEQAELQAEQDRLQAEQDRLYRQQQEQEKRQKQEVMRDKMFQGVQIAFDNFKQLGFNDPFDAVRNILSNFENKWEY